MAAGPDVREDREALEAERDFMLRSLDDLERNRAAGDIDDETYERLHADYTAKAAAVLRALRDGIDARPAPRRTSTRRRVGVVAALLAFATAAAVALSFALGARLPGGEVTGDSQTTSAAASRVDSLKKAAEQRPNDPQAQLAYARFLLAQQQYADALREYDATAKLDPKNAEALAYGGWIVFLANLPDQSLQRLDRAVAVDPKYPDAHFFRGMVLFRGKNQACPAVGEFQRYLAVANDSQMAPQVQQVLQQALVACPSAQQKPQQK